jgi:hypothetical protein
MSEYQYYEFLALERPLSAADREALRALSSRARITKTSFTNHYNWGSFKGDPRKLVERHFDLFLYFANFGTRVLTLRVPRDAFDIEAARRYAFDDLVSIETHRDHAIVEISLDREPPDDFAEPDDDGGYGVALAPLRADLMRGDFRCLYLAWLAAFDGYLIEDDAVEPPLPAGLGELTEALEELIEFLQVDGDLLTVASDGAPPATNISEAELAAALHALPERDKDALLLRLLGDGGTAGLELRRRLEAEVRQRAGAPRAAATSPLRTAGTLRAAAAARAEAREREASARAAEEQARRDREEALRRTRYLDELATRQDAAWRNVDAFIATRRPNDYERAVALLVDLRDVSDRLSQRATFDKRLSGQLAPHAQKPTLIKRLKAAGLV